MHNSPRCVMKRGGVTGNLWKNECKSLINVGPSTLFLEYVAPVMECIFVFGPVGFQIGENDYKSNLADEVVLYVIKQSWAWCIMHEIPNLLIPFAWYNPRSGNTTATWLQASGEAFCTMFVLEWWINDPNSKIRDSGNFERRPASEIHCKPRRLPPCRMN